MELRFWCAGWPDGTAVRRRLGEIDGLGAMHMEPGGRELTVRSFSAESARQAAVRLRELGWRQME